MADARRYWRIVRAILAIDYRATLEIARAIYPVLRDWLRDQGETLSRAATLRHPRKVRKLVEEELPKAPPPPPIPPEIETSEWDVTIHYAKAGDVVDVGVRLIGTGRATREIVRAVVWRLILEKPVNQPGDAWRVEQLTPFDWRKQTRSGRRFRSQDSKPAPGLRGLARKGRWRIERVDVL